ncbi:hypothetical protein D3C84_1016630 [compost metagenome]
MAGSEEFGVVFELLCEPAGIVMTKQLTLCRTGGALNHFEGIAAARYNGKARCLIRFFAAYVLVHLGSGQGRPETQPMEDCLALFDRLVHGDSSVWVRVFVSTRTACWLPMVAGESADG